MRLIVHWLVNAAALYATANLVPGIQVSGLGAVLAAALVIGFLNAMVRPVIFLLTLPITVLSLGLFYFLLNGLMLYLAAWLTPGFGLAGLGSAVLGALVMSLVAAVLHLFVRAG